MSRYSEKIARQKDTGLYRVSDFQNGNGETREITHTIDHLMEDVPMFDREIDILNFADSGRQLQLNTTNGDSLIKLFGPDPENWEGNQVTLYLAPYGKEGKVGIRVKAADGSASTLPHLPAKDEMSDEIPF